MTPSGGWVVFLGPSLPREEARRLLDVRYLPPARRGDVWRVLTSDLEGIVLLDGVFHGEPAVWPRELLDALASGVEVVGACSMGALRAAELGAFGMRGVGRVFQWYRDGILEGDDAVALLHGPEATGWTPLTLPYVTVKATLDRASNEGTLSGTEAVEADRAARALHYQDRTAAAVLARLDDASGSAPAWPRERLDLLRRLLGEGRVDVKADDARQALRAVAAGALRDHPARDRPDPDGHWRALPERWRQDRLLRATFDGVTGADMAQRLAADPARVRRAALEALAEAWTGIEPAAGTGRLAGGAGAEMPGAPPSAVPEHGVLRPAEIRALARRRHRLEAALAREVGPPDARLRAAAARWCAGLGLALAPRWHVAPDPDALGLPWVPEVALLEVWLTDRLLGTPAWA